VEECLIEFHCMCVSYCSFCCNCFIYRLRIVCSQCFEHLEDGLIIQNDNVYIHKLLCLLCMWSMVAIFCFLFTANSVYILCPQLGRLATKLILYKSLLKNNVSACDSWHQIKCSIYSFLYSLNRWLNIFRHWCFCAFVFARLTLLLRMLCQF